MAEELKTRSTKLKRFGWLPQGSHRNHIRFDDSDPPLLVQAFGKCEDCSRVLATCFQLRLNMTEFTLSLGQFLLSGPQIELGGDRGFQSSRTDLIPFVLGPLLSLQAEQGPL